MLNNINDTVIAQKNPLVIYHANCADGFSAAWCFYDHYRQMNNPMDYEGVELGIDFHPGVYSEAPPDVTGRVVYLVDFSYKRAVVIDMIYLAKEIVLIDHHITAIKDLAGLNLIYPTFKAYTDLFKSGAMLAWDYLHNRSGCGVTELPSSDFYDAPPLLLNHIQDRDLWQFKLPLTREISASVFSYGYTFEAWDKLMAADQVELLKIAVAGAAIERKHHKDVAELVKICQRTMTIGLFNVPAASLPYTLTSDAGHLMAANYYDGALFAACYWDTADRRIFSLRSTDNGMDVSAIASQYGGGGHRNAAGFSVPRDHALAIA